ncbi:MAG: polyhydroxyalkanoate synthesis regulator DNA-binding domain-containing protein [Myxococcaceae bacterium]|nr:polyhydroxyalkanoate synthesis regulator DNA-binding domain-containing protein [Myxococcaceae bacterium]
MSEFEQAQNPAAPAREPKVIKRYTNRKLYDTMESRYVTLDEIAEMVKQGTEVRIVDNKSKEDLTSVTLAQIIFEEEKKKNRMPLSVLREIIRHPGESITDFISREVSPRVASIREEAESRIDKLLRRDGEKSEGTNTAPDAAATAAAAAGEKSTPEILRATQRAIEEWQKRLDDRVRQALENVMGTLPAFGRDMQALTDRLEALEKRLHELEAKKR